MAGFINIYNTRIDRSKTVAIIGKNGIHYEYVMPIFSEQDKYQTQALDVKSKKSPKTKYKNGKKPGQYQPVGDKSYFNFYQLKQLRKNGVGDEYIDAIAEVLSRFYRGD